MRLQYSGFIIFAAKMISVATGLVFQFIVARALSRTEYDLWFNINDLGTYFLLMGGALPFWTMRFVAREKEGASKTGIVANLTIAAIATVAYLLLIPSILVALHISATYLPVYFLVAIQIVELHSISVLEACLQARIPKAVGYGLLVQQFCKVVLAYVLIIQLNQLLLGAVVATIAAFALQTVYYFRLLAQELKQKIKWEYIREWLKGSLLNVYSVIGNQIAVYIFIMLFAYGGEGARGIFGSAATVINVITYASFLAYALYPKLLAERKPEDITTALKMVLMFAIPMTTGAVALSDSYMAILRPEYAYAGLVIVVLAIDSFVVVVSGLFASVLYGVETVDEGPRMSLLQLAKSRLFIAFSLPYIHSAITIPTAYYMLTNYARDQPFEAALYVGIINSIARSAMFLVLFFVVRKMVRIDIPWKSIAKYVLAAAVMGVVLYLIPHPARISLTLVETAAGGVIYLALLMAIDKEARALPGYLRQELGRQ
jgi:DNA-binding transcriptional regulator YdaS (Cro superfamily)